MAIVKLESLDMEATHEFIMVINVLKEFIDVISLEFLKTLSSRRGMDHHIELEL